MKLKVQLLAFLVMAFLAVQGQEEGTYEGLCGDCWCTPDNDDKTCPALGKEIHYYPKQDWKVLQTFNLASDAITLQASDGGACSPFKDLLGDDMPERFDEGQLPQCVLNPPQTGNYCGYKYPGEQGEACSGRDYEMVSYNTLEELEADGASLIHAGSCGVCSNAADVWNKLDTLDNISPRTTFCAVSYITSQDFDAMVDCMYNIGWTRECAFLWAHYGVINTLLCAADCIPDTSNTVVGNGPPPECEITPCFKCAQEKYAFDDVHYALTGFSGLKGGVVDRAPSYSCSDYQPVAYDPCVGASAAGGVSDGSSGLQQGTEESGSSGATATTPYYISLFLGHLCVVVFGM